MKRNELNKMVEMKDDTFYKKWFSECCLFIGKVTKKPMTKGECITFFDVYYQQVKSGRMN